MKATIQRILIKGKADLLVKLNAKYHGKCFSHGDSEDMCFMRCTNFRDANPKTEDILWTIEKIDFYQYQQHVSIAKFNVTPLDANPELLEDSGNFITGTPITDVQWNEAMERALAQLKGESI
jgi:hypothetical protein